MAVMALDNDDDFDWEAAVKEIDTACEIASVDSNTILENPEAVATLKPNPNPNLKSKQSTLDRFVDSFRKRRNEIGGSSKDCNYKRPGIDCTGVGNTGAEGGESEVEIDLDAAQTWIYPDNISWRDYQFSIAKVALFSNTLVAVPTGLGKTLIAAVVMYNYFRWFPEGKIVFTAPSRPLVIQQIEACHNIVGISQDWTIYMTGLMTPMKRSGFWTSKRVFFVTPQVLEKDIQSGICPMKQIVCLVIDEAHRALGNYAYCVAVRELMAVPVHLRILALTATPGSNIQAVQNVIDNLCISTLEYRNENDSDVNKYVHNRSVEVIEVEMGKDATDVNSLLLEVIKPFATRLHSYGLLYNRDFATLSPFGLIDLRRKFSDAPPSGLQPDMLQDLNNQFGLLISLYHVRKLLSSHGIRPAYEMLVDQLHSWRMYLSRNEIFMQVKMLMEQSMSRGTPNPKLVKLNQILAGHFKIKDPNASRVIIFSNFRESIKDIMGSLATMGNLVKAAEFIGQSSGKKTLKGQTQKAQQAVLQKFRTGEYNVIVATCIGEEGLDIVEVDLVICFDANVSSLRMIQRMGRTGRKNDGRVVVLACEGSEIKGYRKKQASGKTIIKHMNNGGKKSFNFHSSPRMVPHVCKPQAKFVKFSIEQYVPHGRKVKNDDSVHKSLVSKQLLDSEKTMIRKYFGLAKGDSWKASLIAFPSFQTFPSRVHELNHSFRTTTMLIDAMQNLQMEKMGLTLAKVEATNHSPEITIDAVDNNKQDIHNTATTFQETCTMIEKNSTMKIPHAGCNTHKFSSHCFLYGEDYVTINSLGGVLITSVPHLPNRKHAVSKALPLESSKKMFSGEIIKDEEIVVLETPVSKQKELYQKETICHKAANTKDVKLSPRLTYFIEEGIVPESPIVDKSNVPSPQFTPTHQKFAALTTTQPKSVDRKEDTPCSLKADSVASPDVMKFSDVLPENFTRRDKYDIKVKRNIVFSPDIKDVHKPPAKSIDNNSSEDWQQNSDEASKLSQPPPKYRRLRRFQDKAKQIAYQTPQLKGELNEGRKEKKRKPARFNSFIDEEAEVSQDANVSGDEEFGEREDVSQYEDSFIDDRQHHTVASTASTEAETGDMMAFYRRSLLTQSPVAFVHNNSVTTPHESLLSKSSENECSSSGKLQNRLETPQSGSCSASHQHLSYTDRTSVACGNSTTMSSNKLISRKRKLSYQQLTSITPIKLPLENIPEKEDSNKAMLQNDDLGDDDFFECIDLDAIEEEATKLLRNKSSRSSQGKNVDLDVVCSPPTFDLGI